MGVPSKRNPSNDQILKNVAKFMAQTSVLVARTKLARQYGKSYDGDRDIYTALGYRTNLLYTDYKVKYDRQDIATRIVDAPVDAVWRKACTIEETDSDEGTDSPFEKRWNELEESRHIYNYFARVDKLAGIGRYGVLFMGFNDSAASQPWRPVMRATDLLYLRPYSEENAEIKTWVENKSDPRYGMPEFYELKASTTDRSGSQTFKVHYSRVFHVTDGMLEDDVYGTPRLQNVYNRLENLELVAGGSAEMFWRGAFPGYAWNVDADATASPQDLEDLQTEIEEYMHGLKRYVRTRGITPKELAMQVADPKGHVDVLLELIAGAKGIPKRILVGSERGELASGQDETNWNNTVDQRRKNFVSPWIVRAFIDRMIKYGVLPEVESYDVVWPDIHEVSEKDAVEMNKGKTEILKNYVTAPGADMVVPLDVFLADFLGYRKEEIEAMLKQRDALLIDEQNRIAEEQAILEAEGAVIPEEKEEEENANT